MAISVVRPVPLQWEITGEFLQDWGYWTPDHKHFGVDFGCPIGTRVISATIPGEVVAIHNAQPGQWMSSFGLCVVVKVFNPENGETWFYLYAHLSRADVKVGQTVTPGQLIGLSGDSGDTDGAHLHVQACMNALFARDEALTGDPIRGLRNTTPAPPVTPPGGDAVALARLAAAEAQAALREVVSLNAAIMLRGGISRIAYDPDLARVEQAAIALRKAGFTL